MNYYHKYKKQITVTLLFLIIASIKCTSPNRMKTDIIPQDTYQTNILNTNCASSMTHDFTVSVQELKDEQISLILQNKNFTHKSHPGASLRFPKLTLFIISVENTGDHQLDIADIKLHYDNIILDSLNADVLKTKYNKQPYSFLNFKEILNLFELESDDICDFNIDLSENLAKHTGYINSGDKVFQIIAFDWLPVEIRKFTFSVYIKSDIIKKIIDFKLMRSEYRHSGKYYIKSVEAENNF